MRDKLLGVSYCWTTKIRCHPCKLLPLPHRSVSDSCVLILLESVPFPPALVHRPLSSAAQTDTRWARHAERVDRRRLAMRESPHHEGRREADAMQPAGLSPRRTIRGYKSASSIISHERLTSGPNICSQLRPKRLPCGLWRKLAADTRRDPELPGLPGGPCLPAVLEAD